MERIDDEKDAPEAEAAPKRRRTRKGEADAAKEAIREETVAEHEAAYAEDKEDVPTPEAEAYNEKEQKADEAAIEAEEKKAE